MMDLDESTIQLIERYLRDELSAEDRQAFEARLQAESRLAEEVEDLRRANAAARAYYRDELRGALLEKGKGLLQQEPAPATETGAVVKPLYPWLARRRWLALAASFLLVLAAGWIIWQLNTPPPSPQTLFDQYFERMPTTGLLAGEVIPTTWKDIVADYEAGNCESVTGQLPQLLADTAFAQRSRGLLLQGSCLLQLGQAEEALFFLRQVPAAAASLYREAQWFIALAYLRLDRPAEAAPLLQTLQNDPQSAHREAAENVLRKLK